MNAHELTDFAHSIYDGGYRAEDTEDIMVNFPGITAEELDTVCEILRVLDNYKAEDGAELDIDGDTVFFTERDVPMTFGVYLESDEEHEDAYLTDYEQRSMTKEDLIEVLRPIIAKVKEVSA